MKKILPFIIAVALGAGVFFGLSAYGKNRTAPPSEEAASAPETASVSLYAKEQEETALAPAPNQLPEMDPEEELPALTYKEVLAEEEGLTIYRVQAKRYKGLVAEVTDTSRLTVGVCGEFFSDAINGKQLGTMADNAGAIFGVNGGEFYDPDGNGKGGLPLGNVFVDGEMRCGGYSHTIAMDAEGKMHCGLFSGDDCRNMGVQWALSYGPTLVIDGEIQEGLRTNLEEPRTAVGQREDGTVVFFCIQGRQASALGVTEWQLARIMRNDLGCVNAGNLDGGASSYMYYHGAYMNIANSGNTYPRNVPTCILLMPVEGDTNG